MVLSLPFSVALATRVSARLAVLLLCLPCVAEAQSERGLVISAESRWATNAYGDQLIVTDLEIDIPGERITAQVDGGTLNGLTLAVDGRSVPGVGAAVNARRTSTGWVVSGAQDFSTYARWPTADVPWLLNPANADGIPHDAVERDAIAAAGAWTDQSSANFRMRFAARTTQAVKAYDGNNIVMFRSTTPEAIATTFCWWYADSLAFVDCDIIVWDASRVFFAADTTCSSGAYLLDVLVHEFGHFAGLLHSSVSGATMQSSYSTCSSALRSLHADDIAGIEALYPVIAEPPPDPEPEPPPPCKKKGRWAC